MRLISLTLLLAACAPTADLDASSASSHKAWAHPDRPSLLVDDLVTDFAALPTSGAVAETPWTASYFPTWKDSVNDTWAGEGTDSAVAKYEQAFGVKPGLEDRISRDYGIDSINGKTCTTNADCDKSACAIREGETEGTCIETWFGLCHAWAPVAIMESEPVTPVTHNGVTFAVNDLKALMILSYDAGLKERFLSLRCDDKLDDKAVDAYGNPTNQSCADTNAGSFHLVITNLVGLQKVSLVEDRTIDYEVWNQPIRDFEITKNVEITASQAAELAGDTRGEGYRFNAEAVSFREITMKLRYIGESDATTDGNLAHDIDKYTFTDTYRYVLELDASGAVIGGEWVGASKTDHPDFLWVPTSKAESELGKDGDNKGTGIRWSDVDALVMASQAGTTTGGFDWGTGCEPGSGSFSQPIAKNATVDVGVIPADKADVRVDLTSAADVDIQLVDVATGTELVAWPNGQLNAEGEGCTTFEGTTVCYSGYNGDGTNYGHEWIEVRGATGRQLALKAFGYAAGDAEVTYSFQPLADCVDAGEGSFEQAIADKDVVAVGVLPKGKENLHITLSSDADVDLMLYDGVTPIVGWPDGMLSGDGKASVTYEGATVTWSGYNGDGNGAGHEFITIEGTLQSDLVLKAFGYRAGQASVTYRWGQ